VGRGESKIKNERKKGKEEVMKEGWKEGKVIICLLGNDVLIN
jgi:hypothetical protein